MMKIGPLYTSSETYGSKKVTELGTIDKEVASDFDDCVSSRIAEAVSNQKSNQENI